MMYPDHYNRAVPAALLYIFAFLPGVAASDCRKDLLGREHCGLTSAVWVGLGIAIFAILLSAFFLVKLLLERRRLRRGLTPAAPTPAAMEMDDTGASNAPSAQIIPRFPEPVYKAETPCLPYLPADPPAYEDASDSALHTSPAERPSMYGLYSNPPVGYRPLRDTYEPLRNPTEHPT